jgi:hypothetical protein
MAIAELKSIQSPRLEKDTFCLLIFGLIIKPAR